MKTSTISDAELILRAIDNLRSVHWHLFEGTANPGLVRGIVEQAREQINQVLASDAISHPLDLSKMP